MIVRAPTVAREPIVTNGPIDASGATVASSATKACGSIPGRDAAGGENSETARANAEYGSSVRSTAHPGAADPLAPPRITADRRIDGSWGRKRALATKVRSPGCAC